jgi:hypothetical protein
VERLCQEIEHLRALSISTGVVPQRLTAATTAAAAGESPVGYGNIGSGKEAHNNKAKAPGIDGKKQQQKLMMAEQQQQVQEAGSGKKSWVSSDELLNWELVESGILGVRFYYINLLILHYI